MLAALLTGLGIGLGAGISPGPLLVMVVTSTLRGGWRHGVGVAASPLLSDLIVVTIVLLVLRELSESTLGWLGVVGGAVVVLVGIQTIRDGRDASLSPVTGQVPPPSRDAVVKGALVNLLSPHPWLTWATVLGPLTLAAWRHSPAGGVAVVAGFYLTLVGSKALIAVLVARGRNRLTDSGYRRSVFVAGVLLIGLGVLMAVEFAGSIR